MEVELLWEQKRKGERGWLEYVWADGTRDWEGYRARRRVIEVRRLFAALRGGGWLYPTGGSGQMVEEVSPLPAFE
jgi:hypothetical protein